MNFETSDPVTPTELMEVVAELRKVKDDLELAREERDEERAEHKVTRDELHNALRVITMLQREYGEEDVMRVILQARNA